MKTATKIKNKCNELSKFLISKNKQYGDSALAPIRIFSKSGINEQLRVRIDDKINRLLLGDDSLESDTDVIKDLIGYLILLLISMEDSSIEDSSAWLSRGVAFRYIGQGLCE